MLKLIALIVILPFAIFMVVLVISIITEPYRKAKRQKQEEEALQRIGSKYEDKIASALSKSLNAMPLRNLLFPKEDPGATTEMDMAFVTKKGIFCIECKHRNDAILIHPLEKQWFLYDLGSLSKPDFPQSIHDRGRMEDAFKQNEKHIFYMQRAVRQDVLKNDAGSIVTHNVVSLSTLACPLPPQNPRLFPDCSKITPDNILLTDGVHGARALGKQSAQWPDVYTDADITRITNCLKQFEATKEQIAAHIAYVKAH